ncbi:MAG: hypothetical protein A2758_01970 [Candidatus Zambryskibacteria bacterium RIFCSPHIGHO2_01_FULL_49_18]|uniref:Rod shape-determining protein MreC beta-barrel core domain-containing protein n=2 Tax=Candidatus Zambryskiibacteriota TaxID=1817925 RepID=A0A1G2T331_9BACT|nr:MAG: hypothetical protein A2758_01970 [Candidatus Zambryskibacteria bacterium RIFCSPHIGHO2_01_FULL_49_18]OHB05103.1 MAG: hypothetical protein A3A26_00655 [Candidatus Zambryskibacteria bacterium RIFCSPLOWO2_01_FULL_47_14]
MNYLPRNKGRRPLLKLALFLVGVFAAGVLILYLLDGFLIAVVTPLWRTETWVGTQVSAVKDFFRFKNSLISENTRLKEKLAALQIEAAARFAGGEAGAWSEILGRRAETGGIASTILARPPQVPYDTVVIDAGSNEGVVQDARVFMPEGPALGIVEQVFNSSAKVKLFSTSGEKTAAVLERHGVPVTLEGAGGGNFKIKVPREIEVASGDRILSADALPQLLAVVGEVVMEPTDSFKEILAISPANIFNIHFILVRP